jgi:hypothetical protein
MRQAICQGTLNGLLTSRFAGILPPFTEYRVSSPHRSYKLEIEVQHMRSYSGSVAIPLCLILGGVLLALDRFGIIQISHIWSLWPVTLIAAGMEKLYLWTTTQDRR